MKSFAKAFRATLSIALALCMVMSFVTVSAEATQVTVTQVENSLNRLEDGYYEVQYTVGGITAADADATIMVYSGDAVSKETIKYANQADVAEGNATFTMEVPAGVYTVVAGGTGATSNTAALTANTAPAFATASYTASLDTDAAVGTVVAEGVVATDVDGQDLTYNLTGSDLFAYENGNVVVAAALEAGTYDLTLSATDGIAAAVTATIAVTVEAATIVVNEFAYAKEAIVVEYGTTEITTFPAVSYEGVAFDATWACAEYDAKVAGDYQFLATVSGKDGYDITSAAVPAVTVTVKKAQVAAFDAIEAITVDFGTEESALPLPATVKAGDFVFEVEAWNCEGYTAQTGSYTFTATVKANANCEVAEGAKATVVVNVSAKPVSNVTVTSYAGFENAAKKVGESVELPATVTANLEGYTADTKDVAVTWTYEGEEVTAYTFAKAGTYTFVGTVAEIADEEAAGVIYTFAAADGIAAPAITVEVTKTEVAIEKFEFAAIEGAKYVGTAFADLGLDTEADAFVDGEVVAEFAITWDEASYNSESREAQTITGTINVVDTDAIDYTFAEGADVVAEEITLALRTYEIESVEAIPTLYVTTEADYDVLRAETLVKKVNVLYNNGEKAEVTVTWEEDADVPAEAGETTTITGTLSDLPEFITNEAGKVATMDITTIFEDFTFTVNGSSEDNLVVKVGEAIKVEVAYNAIGGNAEYAYVVNKLGEEAEAPVYEANASKDITIDGAAGNDRYEITVFVKCAGYELSSKKMSVYFASKLVSGDAYVNTNADKTYSALRINKNADAFVVTNSFKNFNGDELTGSFEYKLLDSEKALIATSEDGTFTKDQYADCDGVYSVVVDYIEGEEVVHSASRTIYITDKALWYTDMTINGKAGSGIVVKKASGITHGYVLSDLGAEGVVYTGSEVVDYNGEPTGAAALTAVANTAVENFIALDDVEKGAYTLYALAKLTEGQSFYDMQVGRTVYVKDAITAVCNVLLNGSANSVPVFENETLTIKPYWAAGVKVEPTTTYKVEISNYDLTTKTWSEYVEVECAADGTAEVDKAMFAGAFKSQVKYTMYVNGEETPDATIEKIFYVK